MKLDKLTRKVTTQFITLLNLLFANVTILVMIVHILDSILSMQGRKISASFISGSQATADLCFCGCYALLHLDNLIMRFLFK